MIDDPRRRPRRPAAGRGADRGAVHVSDLALLRALATRPLLTLKVIGAIYWHALRLLLKGLKLRPRPRPPATAVTVVNTRRLAAVTPAGPSLEPRDAKKSARRGVLF